MQSKKNIESTFRKYLNHYAEPCVRTLSVESYPCTVPYSQALIIPLYKETRLLNEIWSRAVEAFQKNHPLEAKVLIILVFNAPNDAPAEAIATTRSALSQLNHNRNELQTIGPFTFSKNEYYDMITIDLISPGICPKQGVGYARKVGADLATWFYFHQKLKNPFISCTDADTTLPPDYFNLEHSIKDQCGSLAPPAALLHTFTHCPFSHQPFSHRAFANSSQPTHAPENLSSKLPAASSSVSKSKLMIAHIFYELYLRHLLANLALAKSPYSYHTIGSILKVNLKAYVQVRGFPKRAAGEDFYLLNKLAKVGKIIELNSQPISISPRLSDRTPFGTGAEVAELLAFPNEVRHNGPGSENNLEYTECLKSASYFYASGCFKLLGTLIYTVETFGNKKDIGKQLSSLLPNALFQSIYSGLINSDRNSASKESFVKHFHQWFDSFRTIKWLNLASKFYPKVPFKRAFTQEWLDEIERNSDRFVEFRNNCVQITILLSKL